MKTLFEHSMCRHCWNKAHPGKSSVGHETPTRFRVQEVCCFCLHTHKSGIYVPKDQKDSSVTCNHKIPYGHAANKLTS